MRASDWACSELLDPPPVCMNIQISPCCSRHQLRLCALQSLSRWSFFYLTENKRAFSKESCFSTPTCIPFSLYLISTMSRLECELWLYLNPWTPLQPSPDYNSIIHPLSHIYFTYSFPLGTSPQAVHILILSLLKKKSHHHSGRSGPCMWCLVACAFSEDGERLKLFKQGNSYWNFTQMALLAVWRWVVEV